MHEGDHAADRLAAYSDAVFAVIVTIMVLELKAPDEPAFSALWPLWPTIVSYAVSYLFIAIIWINHHYLMRFVSAPAASLIWINFIHLFMVSLLPFATAWVARPRLASSPVTFCGTLRVCRHCLQRLRARSPRPRGNRTSIRGHTADREAPLTRRPRNVHDRDAGGARRA